MLSTWLFSDVLAIESKPVSLPNACLTKIACDSCQLIFKKRKERLVISSLTIAQTRRVISKCCVLSSAPFVDIRLLTTPRNRTKQSKRPVTRKTLPAKLDHQEIASCSQILPANWKKSHGHFLLIQFGLKQPISLYKIICKERPAVKPYQKTLGSRK